MLNNPRMGMTGMSLPQPTPFGGFGAPMMMPGYPSAFASQATPVVMPAAPPSFKNGSSPIATAANLAVAPVKPDSPVASPRNDVTGFADDDLDGEAMTEAAIESPAKKSAIIEHEVEPLEYAGERIIITSPIAKRQDQSTEQADEITEEEPKIQVHIEDIRGELSEEAAAATEEEINDNEENVCRNNSSLNKSSLHDKSVTSEGEPLMMPASTSTFPNLWGPAAPYNL
jgi:hypothetical protein